MSDTVRTPKQQRSIDKKNRIIEAGYNLFAQKGYYSTNTAEIAKEAGVSTGIVYGYFRDKRDILIEVLDIYVKKVFNPILNLFAELKSPINFDYLLEYAIDGVVKTHSENAAIHEALHSLTHTDKNINDKFIMLENKMTAQIVQSLLNVGINADNLPERVHIAIQNVEMFAHESVFDKHEYISYPQMRALIINMLKALFEIK